VLNYVSVFVLDWGITGAALATVISNNLLPLLLWIYVWVVNPQSLQCWGGFSRSAFTHWGPMAELAVPGIIMVETEWLAFVRKLTNSIHMKRTLTSTRTFLLFLPATSQRLI